ncbi:MAG TPA: sulfite exporter TauE/SafE family protein [Anaerolineae bacterium]|nr:sulfite exporter TauE/SafE family protein [Anaerolineae bacterium]
MIETILLACLFFLTAVLYAAVGLGGGSGYLAIMGIVGLPPEVIRPTALSLNILVAGLGTWKHIRAGQFSARLFWPIALMSIPFAFLGGRLTLPGDIYRPLAGAVLLYAAGRLWLSSREKKDKGEERRRPYLPIWVTLIAGAGIGLVSGLMGMGGGIFLGPLLLLTGWAGTRETMGITAAFVLVNSIAGLAGHISTIQSLPPAIPLWLLAAGIGGWIGAEYGSRRLDPRLLRKLLALVLAVGGLRLIFF